MAKFYAKAPNGDDAVLSISIQAFTQSLQQNGWCKLPNGLIIQWYESGIGDESSIIHKIPLIIHMNTYMTLYSSASVITNLNPSYSIKMPVIFWNSTESSIYTTNLWLGTLSNTNADIHGNCIPPSGSCFFIGW